MNRDYPARPSRRQGRGERFHEGHERRPEGPTFRLFIAVEIPPEVTRRLAGWQQEYLAGDRALRLTPEEQLHITLVFLGHMREKELGLASEQMDELDGESPPDSFDVTADGVVGLPRRGAPRVIAAAIEEPAGILRQIHDRLVAGLVEKQLYQREKRPFFPHVTIARVRGRTQLDLEAIHPDPVKFTAVRITLYNSILKSSGVVHKALKTVQLN
ncbi:MAG: RNA 2',3'-cyclic phosphodiesterase [Thermoleophilia bacterium]